MDQHDDGPLPFIDIMEAVPRDLKIPGSKWIVWIHCDVLGGGCSRLFAGPTWSNFMETGPNDTRDAPAVNPFARRPASVGGGDLQTKQFQEVSPIPPT